MAKDNKKQNNKIGEGQSLLSTRKDDETHERHWYAVHTYSGYEDAVLSYLKQRIESLTMEDKIFDVIVPKETKIKIKDGKRKKIEEKIYPGYVLVDMIKDSDSWYVVRNTPRVTGFVGADPTEPTPLSKQEVDRILSKVGDKDPEVLVDFDEGEPVKIIDGPFKDYDGKVIEVDQQRGKLKVSVAMFGRDTTVELDSLQVDKI